MVLQPPAPVTPRGTRALLGFACIAGHRAILGRTRLPAWQGAEGALRYHAGMLTRRRLLTGLGVTALAFAGLARGAAADSATAITVYKNPT